MTIKRSLSKQITIIFITAFMITLTLLSIFLNRSLSTIYETVIYDRLESEGKAISLYLNPTNYSPAENIGFISYAKDTSNYEKSVFLPIFVDEDTISLLIKKAEMQEATSGNYVNRVNQELLYYSIFKYEGFFDIIEERCIIVLTDDTIKNQLVRETFLKLFFYGFIAFSIGYLLILLWARYLVNGIKIIKKGIHAMSKSFYKEDIPLKRRDELGELASSINTMRGQIYNNNQSKQELIQGVSHDLKTPIAVIRSYAEAMEDGLSQPAEAAAIILKQTKRLNEKVNNLLNLTRLDYITINRGEMETIRMDTIISDLQKAYSFQTTATFDVDCQEAVFDGDSESWRIAVENILDNAIRYAKSLIRIRMDKDFLSIYNDGPAIDETYMESLFKPYEKSTDGVFGLGLSIVYKTVHLYGYRIEVINQDEGVSFIITRG